MRTGRALHGASWSCENVLDRARDALVEVFGAGGLPVGEKLVASRGVTVDRQHLDVSISQHADEQFWRVEVRHPVGPTSTRTALDGDDNFLCHLIRSAVAGEGSAWESLARLGHRHFSPPTW
ncbi:MAG: hypothetical protein ABSE77_08275 [Acidimicrobiales bacterium]